MKSAFQEFNQICGQIEHNYHEAAVRMGLPDSEFWIIYTLVTNGPVLRQSALVDITGKGKTTVNSALKKMERQGLLTLSAGTGRSTTVQLTPSGEQLASKTVCRLVELENQIYESWSPEEQRMLTQLNRDYADKLRSALQKI